MIKSPEMPHAVERTVKDNTDFSLYISYHGSPLSFLLCYGCESARTEQINKLLPYCDIGTISCNRLYDSVMNFL